jgi:diacylglycerol kinase
MTAPRNAETEPSPPGAVEGPPPGPRGAGGLAAAFGHALRGLAEVGGERNMRIHLLAGAAVGLAGTELPLPLASRLALHLATALVIGAEAFNSALEALVDLHTVELHPRARRAKDAAAGAVLVLAVGSVLVAGAVAVDGREAIAAWLARPGWVAAVVLDGALLLGMALLQAAPRGAVRWRTLVLAAVAALLVAALARTASVTLTAQAALLVAWAGVAGARAGTPSPT